MNILKLDIETAPHSAYIWSLWTKFIGSDDIEVPGYPLCFAAQWMGKKPIMFRSVWEDGLEGMCKSAFELLDQADAVIHYNGRKFDIPMLNTEFMLLDMGVPSPYQQIDLLPVVRKNFRFPSNKLDYVCKRLGIGAKITHRGMELWTEVMKSEPKACREMKKYNKRDVELLGPLYERLLPWISNHPNYALYANTERPVCPNCGGEHLQSRGTYPTKTQLYKRFLCMDCGTWTRSRFTDVSPEKRQHIMVQAKL